jgi:mRNA-degrading endonuclease RelE of RelBE toxin-antitoxin system
MKAWRVRFTMEAARLVSNLHPEIKKQIKKELSGLRENPYTGKDLQGELSGFKSQRSKQHRIIYDLDEHQKSIRVYVVGRRSDVYEQFRRLLADLRELK